MSWHIWESDEQIHYELLESTITLETGLDFEFKFALCLDAMQPAPLFVGKLLPNLFTTSLRAQENHNAFDCILLRWHDTAIRWRVNLMTVGFSVTATIFFSFKLYITPLIHQLCIHLLVLERFQPSATVNVVGPGLSNALVVAFLNRKIYRMLVYLMATTSIF